MAMESENAFSNVLEMGPCPAGDQNTIRDIDNVLNLKEIRQFYRS